jgi:LPXTG-site transpeptidase (sortase) family protein
MNFSSFDPSLQTELIEVYRKALRSGLSLSEVEHDVLRHLKKLTVSTSAEAHAEQTQEQQLKKAVPAAVRWGAFVLPLLFIAVGLFLVGNAVLPIMRYYLENSAVAQAARLTSPIPEGEVIDVNPVVIAHSAVAEEKVPSEPKILDTQLDFTNLSNWFSADVVAKLKTQRVGDDEYVIDIPEVKIEGARVVIGGVDLNESLIAYPGTALPGELGAPVVFGHSVLRQFYYPSEKNPRRYTSIFSYIMTLKKGDPIYVTHKGVKYTYVVTDKSEVKPEDVYILSQRYDSRQLKLVTCVPEGTYLRRGVVTAQLVPTETPETE